MLLEQSSLVVVFFFFFLCSGRRPPFFGGVCLLSVSARRVVVVAMYGQHFAKWFWWKWNNNWPLSLKVANSRRRKGELVRWRWWLWNVVALFSEYLDWLWLLLSAAALSGQNYQYRDTMWRRAKSGGVGSTRGGRWSPKGFCFGSFPMLCGGRLSGRADGQRMRPAQAVYVGGRGKFWTKRESRESDYNRNQFQDNSKSNWFSNRTDDDDRAETKSKAEDEDYPWDTSRILTISIQHCKRRSQLPFD